MTTPPILSEHVREVMWNKLKSIKLADVITSVDAVGPVFVMAGSPPQPGIGWQLSVGLRHNRLIGQPPIIFTAGLGGVMPPDEMFEKFAEFLLEKAREERDRLNAMPVDKPDVTPGRSLPPGLQGKSLKV